MTGDLQDGTYGAKWVIDPTQTPVDARELLAQAADVAARGQVQQVQRMPRDALGERLRLALLTLGDRHDVEVRLAVDDRLHALADRPLEAVHRAQPERTARHQAAITSRVKKA